MLRFLIGWPLWFVFGSAMVVIAWFRWRLQGCRQDQDLMVVALMMTLHGLICWLSLLTTKPERPLLLYSQAYTASTIVVGLTLGALVVASLVRAWRSNAAN